MHVSELLEKQHLLLPRTCMERIEDFSKRKVWGRIVLQFRAGEIINVEVAESVTLERNGGLVGKKIDITEAKMKDSA